MSKVQPSTGRLIYVLLGILICVGLVIYWPGLSGSFFYDDGPSILNAPGVKLENLTWEGIRQVWASGGAGPLGRPVAQLSFGLNYYFSGFSAFAFKLTNLTIHLVTTVLVYALSSRIISESDHSSVTANDDIAAFIIAAVWLLHPIQLLPVLHVVQRMTSLSALFLLAATYLHMSGRDKYQLSSFIKILVAWTLLWPLSVLTKETGLLFPAFVLVWELTLRWIKRGYLDTFARTYTGLCICVLLFVIYYLSSVHGQWIWQGYEIRTFTVFERLLTEARVVWAYIGQIVFPRLSAFALYHDDIVISTSWINPSTTLIAVLGLLAMFVVALCVRATQPLIAFGLIWFLVGHLMESTFLPLEIAHEHRNYLPLFGVLIAVAGIWKAFFTKDRIPPRALLVLMLLAGFAGLLVTGLRAYEFGDEIRRTQTAAAYHPGSARAHYEAGSTLASLPTLTSQDSELYPIAKNHLTNSMRLDENFKLGGLALIYLHCKTGQKVDTTETKELVRRLEKTPFGPGDTGVLFTMKEMALTGTLCLQRNDVAKMFDSAIANSTVSPSVRAILYSWYADYLWLVAKDMQAARGALGYSLALNPANPSNRLKWAQLMYLSGERLLAVKLLDDLHDESLTADEQETIRELQRAINMGS